jgi:hypothetical protein
VNFVWGVDARTIAPKGENMCEKICAYFAYFCAYFGFWNQAIVFIVRNGGMVRQSQIENAFSKGSAGGVQDQVMVAFP